MAITINVQDNPLVGDVGTSAADATIITSGVTTGNVIYQIQRMDETDEIATIDSELEYNDTPNIVSVSSTNLQIILPGRQDYKVRCQLTGRASAWSSWVPFKTRDKNYKTPDAITQLSTNFDTTPNARGSKTITVTNSAKATVVNTAQGATVTNTDYGYVGTSNIAYTNRGATVTTDSF